MAATTPLETALHRALHDAAARPAFYRELLRSEVLVLNAATEAATAEGLSLLLLDSGELPLFTDSARIFDGGATVEEVQATWVNGRALLEATRGQTLVLNPFSEEQKQLSPAEIADLLAGELTSAADPDEVLIGQPKEYPTALVAALRAFLADRPAVQAAYLAYQYSPQDGRPPHALIGLELTDTTDAATLVREAGTVAQHQLAAGETVAFRVLGADAAPHLDQYFRRDTQPFFRRA